MTNEICGHTNYVCGFAFDKILQKVVLIKKNRGPAFNIGKWNGVGGKMNLGEGHRTAMAREFLEETDILTEASSWQCFLVERGRSGTIYWMTTTVDSFDGLRQNINEVETEPVFVFHTQYVIINDLNGFHLLAYNLGYLIPMALTWIRHPDKRWL